MKSDDRPPLRSKHHFMPLGYYGPNIPENIEIIPHDLHVELHKTMNLHGTEIAIRRAWGNLHKPKHHTPWYVTGSIDAVLRLQHRYYSRYKKLSCEWLRKKHIEKLHELTNFYSDTRIPFDWNFQPTWGQYAIAMKEYYHRERFLYLKAQAVA